MKFIICEVDGKDYLFIFNRRLIHTEFNDTVCHSRMFDDFAQCVSAGFVSSNATGISFYGESESLDIKCRASDKQLPISSMNFAIIKTKWNASLGDEKECEFIFLFDSSITPDVFFNNIILHKIGSSRNWVRVKSFNPTMIDSGELLMVNGKLTHSTQHITDLLSALI